MSDVTKPFEKCHPRFDAPLHRKREARAWLPGPPRGAFADDPRIWNRVVSCGTLWLKARCRRGEPPALALQPFRTEPAYDPARSSGPLPVVAWVVDTHSIEGAFSLRCSWKASSRWPSSKHSPKSSVFSRASSPNLSRCLARSAGVSNPRPGTTWWGAPFWLIAPTDPGTPC